MAEGELFDLVIIGGGPGGLTAGLYAMRAALKTVLIEKGLPGGQINLTKDVENYPGFENIMGFDLAQKFLLHAQAYGLEVRQAEVAAVEPGLAYHTVRLANGETLIDPGGDPGHRRQPPQAWGSRRTGVLRPGGVLLRHLRRLLFPG